MKAKLKKYFSGKLAIIQIASGVGAVAFRSIAAHFSEDHATWIIVTTSQLGSFVGYIGAYALGYWITFRHDYKTTNRSIRRDVARLQIVEQTPNIATVIPAALTQAALIEAGDVEPVVSVNLASWFGPHKIVNFIAMLTSNSLKKGWVDNTWKPAASFRGFLRWIFRKS